MEWGKNDDWGNLKGVFFLIIFIKKEENIISKSKIIFYKKICRTTEKNRLRIMFPFQCPSQLTDIKLLPFFLYYSQSQTILFFIPSFKINNIILNIKIKNNTNII